MGLRDRRQSNKRNCPQCGRTVWRLSDDKFTQCHRCGWTAGIPVLRWFTRPSWILYLVENLIRYPAQTLWNFGKLAVALIVVGSVLIVSASTVTPSASQGPLSGLPDAPSVNVSVSDSLQGWFSEEEINETEVEQHFIRYLNEERSRRGLQNVSQRDVLTEMGENHSRSMARHDYIGHVEPDGTNITERYRNRGLLPECRLPIQGTNRYYAGAENVVGAWVYEEFNAWKTGETLYIDSEEELARYLFKTWMRSPPHRRAMLVASADEAGLGLNITDEGKVYASLELC